MNPSTSGWHSFTTGCSLCCASQSCATASGNRSTCVPAWDGNWTWDCFLAFAWQGPVASGCW